MDIFGIKKYIEKKDFLKNEKRFGLHTNLKRDWKIIIFLFLFVNFLSLVYGYYFFYRIVSENIFETKDLTEQTNTNNDVIKSFDKTKLIEELKKFENKKGCSIVSEENNLTTSDPSL